jgi:hypothetical protein
MDIDGANETKQYARKYLTIYITYVILASYLM